MQISLFTAIRSRRLLDFTIDRLQLNGTELSNELYSQIRPFQQCLRFCLVEPRHVLSPEMSPVNAVLFKSLTLAFIETYLTITGKGWLQYCNWGWSSSNVPEERARAREIHPSSNPRTMGVARISGYAPASHPSNVNSFLCCSPYRAFRSHCLSNFDQPRGWVMLPPLCNRDFVPQHNFTSHVACLQSATSAVRHSGISTNYSSVIIMSHPHI